MIRLRIGYLMTGIITGLLLLLSFFSTIPDGKLHIIMCDVGQGDGIYIRFPDGKDMIIDGGPGNKIIGCLSRHMPFWDRTIDLAFLTHPEKDHINGLIAVLERYTVQFLMRSDVSNTTEGFEKLVFLVNEKKISEQFATSRETITIGPSVLSVLWPSKDQIALMKPPKGETVLGATTGENLNDASIVFSLSYGTFDALFMGDADSHIQPRMITGQQPDHFKHLGGSDGTLELFKVPHHGSKTGLTDPFLQKVRPDITIPGKKPLAVISVGQNSYGHPDPEIIYKLESSGFQVMRTDKEGDIEVISDGKEWNTVVTGIQ